MVACSGGAPVRAPGTLTTEFIITDGSGWAQQGLFCLSLLGGHSVPVLPLGGVPRAWNEKECLGGLCYLTH